MQTTTLQTPRLTLTPFQPSDLDALHALWIKPEVRQYLWDDEIIPIEQTRAILEENERMFREEQAGIWKITPKEEPVLAGFAGYWYFFEPPELQLFYGLDPECWGKGYATEATEALLRYGFEVMGQKTIVGATDPPHQSSMRVMERIGMRVIERESGVSGGDEKPTVFYAIDRGDWAG